MSRDPAHARAPGAHAAIESATASQTISAAGPDHMRNAAGSERGSHGRTTRTSIHSGASDAPARHAASTPTAAVTQIANAAIEAGRSAMNPLPVPVAAIVPCDSHAAEAVHNMMTARSERGTDGRARIGDRMSSILHGATSGYHRGPHAARGGGMRRRGGALSRDDVASRVRLWQAGPDDDDGRALQHLEHLLG